MSEFLVTGVAGFIGSKVAEFLVEEGNMVVGVDNLNDYYDVNLKHHRLQALKAMSGFQFIELDIESKEATAQLLQNHTFEAIINLAARAGVRQSLLDPHVYMTTNAIGTLNLLEGMRHGGPRKMVLASTSSLYAGEKMPFLESLPVNTPISPYAASKKAAESMAYTYHSLFGIDVSVVRYFTVFGPVGRPDMCIFRFIKWIAEGQPIELFGDGSQSRDFTYVDDIARGTIAAVKPVGYEVINLGGGNNPISLNQIIQWIEQDLGKKAIIRSEPFQETDIKETWADISKASELLGWSPKVDIREGVRKAVNHYLENEAFYKSIQLP